MRLDPQAYEPYPLPLKELWGLCGGGSGTASGHGCKTAGEICSFKAKSNGDTKSYDLIWQFLSVKGELVCFWKIFELGLAFSAPFLWFLWLLQVKEWKLYTSSSFGGDHRISESSKKGCDSSCFQDIHKKNSGKKTSKKTANFALRKWWRANVEFSSQCFHRVSPEGPMICEAREVGKTVIWRWLEPLSSHDHLKNFL